MTQKLGSAKIPTTTNGAFEVQRIRDRLVEIKKDQKDLAAALGVSDSRVSDCLAGKRQFKTKEMKGLASFLGWTSDYLLEVLHDPLPVFGEAKKAALASSWGPEFDFDIFTATDLGGGIFMMSAEPADKTSRPGFLTSSPSSFAVYIVSDAMSPKYERGDMVFVDAAHPAGLGDHALFTSAPRDDGTVTYTVRRLIEVNDLHWTVRQYSPDKTMKLSRLEWPTAQKVVGTRAK